MSNKYSLVGNEVSNKPNIDANASWCVLFLVMMMVLPVGLCNGCSYQWCLVRMDVFQEGSWWGAEATSWEVKSAG